MKTLFKENKSVIDKCIIRIEKIEGRNDFEVTRNNFTLAILRLISRSPDVWDCYCQINIKWIGDKFINDMLEDKNDKHHLDELCSSCFRFLMEYDLSIQGDFSHNLISLKQELLILIDSFDENARSQLQFAQYQMPISIFKEIAYSSEINDIRGFNETIKNAKDLKVEWDQELKTKQEDVLDIKASLEKYKNAYNFVGLYDGFNELHAEKVAEKNNIRLWMIISSVLIVSPIAFEFIYVYLNANEFETVKKVLMLSFFPTVSLIGISMYYFRILLVNYKSVKSQILQLDLRKTLCRFIQHYADYSKEIKSHDKESLDKFESIIFSRIVGDNEKLPSAFDGFEQLSKLIKSVR